MSEPQGRPARYERTFSGLVASLVVTVLVIGAFVLFRAAVRTDPDGSPSAVDWQSTVREVPASDRLVHPTTVPAGWKVTSANYLPGRVPDARSWDLGALTSQGDFAGLAQRGSGLGSLVSAYIDKNAKEGAAVTIRSPLGTTWRSFTDSGGDYGVGLELTGGLAGQALLVYGTASPSVIRSYAASLTGDPLPQPSTSPSSSPS